MTTRKPGKRALARPRGVSESAPAYALDRDDAARAQRLIGVLGNSRVAELLNVAKSQPARWASGRDRVSAENAGKLIDLDYVISRLLRRWHPTVLEDWLEGNNPHLRARPTDVIRLRGPAAIIPAINAEESGAME